MNPTDSTNPRSHLARSYSAPMRLHDGTPPSRLVDALDVGTAPKRTRSNQRLAPATPQLVSPVSPRPDSPPTDVIRVRSIDVNGQTLKGDVHVLVEENTDARWLLRRVCFQRDKNGKYQAVPTAVGQGSHGKAYMARYEPKDGPPSLWILKETQVLQRSTDNLPRVRSQAHIDQEIRTQHASGSEFYAQKCLQWGDKLLLASPPGHGDLSELKTWLQQLPHAQADMFVMDMVVQLLRRLTYMANAPSEDELIVHCDIKPENILYRKDLRRFYLIDFSIAEFGEADDAHYCGTPGFIAPEFLRGIRTPKADMWSLGVTMMDMLTCSFLNPMVVTYPPRDEAMEERNAFARPPAPVVPRPPPQTRTGEHSVDSYEAFMASLFGKAKMTESWQDIGVPAPRVAPAALAAAPQPPTTEVRNAYYMVLPMERYKHWSLLYKAWQKDPNAPAYFSSQYPDIDETVGYIQRRFPQSFSVMMRLLEWDPDNRPTAEALLDELDRVPSRDHQRALARLWNQAPISRRIERVMNLYTEPTLPPLHRTTSADNVAAMACDAKPARKTKA